MSARSKRDGRPFVGAVLVFLGAVACGGRVTELDETAAAGASGGSAGAGAAGALGTAKQGGSAGALGSSGPGSSQGGAGATSGCSCSASPDVCPGGYIYSTAPGSCCAICTEATSTDCTQGQANYVAFITDATQQYSACKTDADCDVASNRNACDAGCGIPVNAKYVTELSQMLEQYAVLNCSNCPTFPVPNCIGSEPPSCLQGVCTFESFNPPPT